MTTKLILDFLAEIAWPLVGIVGIIYLWKSNLIVGIAKEIAAVSKAVDEFRPMITELSETERKLQESAGTLAEINNKLAKLPDQINALNASIDLVLERTLNVPVADEDGGPAKPAPPEAATHFVQLEEQHLQMQRLWDQVTALLEHHLGNFDKRSVGQEAFRLTHGNRKARLSGEAAEAISRLHSKIKSYNRRSQTREDWLTDDVFNEFRSECEKVIETLEAL